MSIALDALHDLRGHAARAALGGFALFIAVLAMIAISLQAAVADASAVARLERDNGRAPTVRGLVTARDAALGRQEALLSALDHRVGAELDGTWLAIDRHANDLELATKSNKNATIVKNSGEATVEADKTAEASI